MNRMSEIFHQFLNLSRVELILFSASCIVFGSSLWIFFYSEAPPSIAQEESPSVQRENFMYVDVSGAVEKPDIYKFPEGARLKEALTKAGGLSTSADHNFFGRNFNVSRVLTDQEKIYVPSTEEVESKIYSELPKIVQLNTNNSNYAEPQNVNISSLISINSASLEELMSLPQIGAISANKIAQNRPYTTIDELKTKKVVSNSTFDQIKILIGL